MEKLLLPQEVANILGITTKALAQLRYEGSGPTYQRISPRAIRYSTVAVTDFIDSTSRSGTAALRNRRPR